MSPRIKIIIDDILAIIVFICILLLFVFIFHRN